MSRAQLVNMARDNIAHARKGTTNLQPSEANKSQAHDQFELLRTVVQEEDYGTGLRQQQALQTGAMGDVLFGRNEGGGHRFHSWVDRLLETEDDDLNRLFETGIWAL